MVCGLKYVSNNHFDFIIIICRLHNYENGIIIFNLALLFAVSVNCVESEEVLFDSRRFSTHFIAVLIDKDLNS